ncbi:hypothetical protein I4F81_004604 [Pyropia yezoensis]|uniref:Uncharacterized protein n=1 Tax=Pyropia yezoensis TaxID=2788 RepID=A0ACC3BVW2_PYRYE|nr:hypothetical protein I4F81_004604 [Neopyropia yezoensis]
MLTLRALNVTASVLMLAFNAFALERPVWLALRWGTLFVAINAAHIGVLLRERAAGLAMPAAARDAYDRWYRGGGMCERAFVRLVDAGAVVQLRRGDRLTSGGEPNGGLWLVTDGAVRVAVGGVVVARAQTAGSWVGERGFLRGQTLKSLNAACGRPSPAAAVRGRQRQTKGGGGGGCRAAGAPPGRAGRGGRGRGVVGWGGAGGAAAQAAWVDAPMGRCCHGRPRRAAAVAAAVADLQPDVGRPEGERRLDRQARAQLLLRFVIKPRGGDEAAGRTILGKGVCVRAVARQLHHLLPIIITINGGRQLVNNRVGLVLGRQDRGGGRVANLRWGVLDVVTTISQRVISVVIASIGRGVITVVASVGRRVLLVEVISIERGVLLVVASVKRRVLHVANGAAGAVTAGAAAAAVVGIRVPRVDIAMLAVPPLPPT